MKWGNFALRLNVPPEILSDDDVCSDDESTTDVIDISSGDEEPPVKKEKERETEKAGTTTTTKAFRVEPPLPNWNTPAQQATAVLQNLVAATDPKTSDSFRNNPAPSGAIACHIQTVTTPTEAHLVGIKPRDGPTIVVVDTPAMNGLPLPTIVVFSPTRALEDPVHIILSLPLCSLLPHRHPLRVTATPHRAVGDIHRSPAPHSEPPVVALSSQVTLDILADPVDHLEGCSYWEDLLTNLLTIIMYILGLDFVRF
ncbi:hypothetical protein V5O48_013871 [Marasmius crinis-equi]|uniref:Uncharacterized protein n=1 Tax=Marasmius crinis-equi TaxID=585013 RepID=A0ABR3EYW7_9AGAR